MDEKGLGLRLQNARKTAGFTQQQLCQKADISYSTLAKIERGAIKSPSIFTIQQIAVALETSIDVLVGNTGEHLQKVSKKQSKSGINFVYFDINGCLVHFYQRAFAMVAEATGVQSDVIETIYWHYNDAVCRGDVDMEEFNTTLAQRFGVDSLDWNQFYLDAIETIPEAQELLLWTQEHYSTGLLSNIMPGVIPEMIKRKILPDIPYDSIVESSTVKAIKPEPAIYEVASKQAGVEPSSILLIDDSRANLIAAERLGWRVLWFDDYRPKESVERIRQALQF